MRCLIVVLLVGFVAAGKLSSRNSISIKNIPKIYTSQLTNSENSAGKCDCGKKQSYTENRNIVGGSDAKSGEFPWFVYLSIYKNDVEISHTCGGTIISPNWVITAAQCTENAKHIFVSSDSDTTSADEIIQHEEYDKDNLTNDMSLIHVITPFQFGESVGPACLPWDFRNKEFHGINVTATGFGSTVARPNDDYESVAFPDTLQKVTLQVVGSQECRNIFELEGLTISDSLICAYAPGKGPCNGDSGGAIEYFDPATERSSIIGVISWGWGGCAQGFPSGFTRVTSYLDWIQAKTGETFCKDN